MAAPQDFKTHRRIVPGYHIVLTLLLLGTAIGAVVNLVNVDPAGIYSASLILALSVAVIMTAYYARAFALKAQDRAIRAEERLRYYALTGKHMDGTLTIRQIIGLRFASDEEFPELAARAANEGISEKDIKVAVRNWRADHDRA